MKSKHQSAISTVMHAIDKARSHFSKFSSKKKAIIGLSLITLFLFFIALISTITLQQSRNTTSAEASDLQSTPFNPSQVVYESYLVGETLHHRYCEFNPDEPADRSNCVDASNAEISDIRFTEDINQITYRDDPIIDSDTSSIGFGSYSILIDEGEQEEVRQSLVTYTGDNIQQFSFARKCDVNNGLVECAGVWDPFEFDLDNDPFTNGIPLLPIQNPSGEARNVIGDSTTQTRTSSLFSTYGAYTFQDSEGNGYIQQSLTGFNPEDRIGTSSKLSYFRNCRHTDGQIDQGFCDNSEDPQGLRTFDDWRFVYFPDFTDPPNVDTNGFKGYDGFVYNINGEDKLYQQISVIEPIPNIGAETVYYYRVCDASTEQKNFFTCTDNNANNEPPWTELSIDNLPTNIISGVTGQAVKDFSLVHINNFAETIERIQPTAVPPEDSPVPPQEISPSITYNVEDGNNTIRIENAKFVEIKPFDNTTESLFDNGFTGLRINDEESEFGINTCGVAGPNSTSYVVCSLEETSTFELDVNPNYVGNVTVTARNNQDFDNDDTAVQRQFVLNYHLLEVEASCSEEGIISFILFRQNVEGSDVPSDFTDLYKNIGQFNEAPDGQEILGDYSIDGTSQFITGTELPKNNTFSPNDIYAPGTYKYSVRLQVLSSDVSEQWPTTQGEVDCNLNAQDRLSITYNVSGENNQIDVNGATNVTISAFDEQTTQIDQGIPLNNTIYDTNAGSCAYNENNTIIRCDTNEATDFNFIVQDDYAGNVIVTASNGNGGEVSETFILNYHLFEIPEPTCSEEGNVIFNLSEINNKYKNIGGINNDGSTDAFGVIADYSIRENESLFIVDEGDRSIRDGFFTTPETYEPEIYDFTLRLQVLNQEVSAQWPTANGTVTCQNEEPVETEQPPTIAYNVEGETNQIEVNNATQVRIEAFDNETTNIDQGIQLIDIIYQESNGTCLYFGDETYGNQAIECQVSEIDDFVFPVNSDYRGNVRVTAQNNSENNVEEIFVLNYHQFDDINVTCSDNRLNVPWPRQYNNVTRYTQEIDYNDGNGAQIEFITPNTNNNTVSYEYQIPDAIYTSGIGTIQFSLTLQVIDDPTYSENIFVDQYPSFSAEVNCNEESDNTENNDLVLIQNNNRWILYDQFAFVIPNGENYFDTDNLPNPVEPGQSIRLPELDETADERNCTTSINCESNSRVTWELLLNSSDVDLTNINLQLLEDGAITQAFNFEQIQRNIIVADVRIDGDTETEERYLVLRRQVSNEKPFAISNYQLEGDILSVQLDNDQLADIGCTKNEANFTITCDGGSDADEDGFIEYRLPLENSDTGNAWYPLPTVYANIVNQGGEVIVERQEIEITTNSNVASVQSFNSLVIDGGISAFEIRGDNARNVNTGPGSLPNPEPDIENCIAGEVIACISANPVDRWEFVLNNRSFNQVSEIVETLLDGDSRYIPAEQVVASYLNNDNNNNTISVMNAKRFRITTSDNNVDLTDNISLDITTGSDDGMMKCARLENNKQILICETNTESIWAFTYTGSVNQIDDMNVEYWSPFTGRYIDIDILPES